MPREPWQYLKSHVETTSLESLTGVDFVLNSLHNPALKESSSSDFKSPNDLTLVRSAALSFKSECLDVTIERFDGSTQRLDLDIKYETERVAVVPEGLALYQGSTKDDLAEFFEQQAQKTRSRPVKDSRPLVERMTKAPLEHRISNGQQTRRFSHWPSIC
ncbi:hypothetical protein SVAN01_05093 [Stagonosporopsis vannaccii]|nr:hypothetical protein SVAN01_05093 [Stagonosporopsis vannaccii]